MCVDEQTEKGEEGSEGTRKCKYGCGGKGLTREREAVKWLVCVVLCCVLWCGVVCMCVRVRVYVCPCGRVAVLSVCPCVRVSVSVSVSVSVLSVTEHNDGLNQEHLPRLAVRESENSVPCAPREWQ